MTPIRYLEAIIVAYLLGSLPVGYLCAKLSKRIDIRQVGSGHTGGSNVLRAAGTVPAVLTVVGDFLKGYGAVSVAQALVPGVPLVAAAAGLFAVVGHNHPLFLGFKGGVGTMTTLGAAMALMPVATSVAIFIGALVLLIGRYTSIGSLTLAVVLPLACLIGAVRGDWPTTHLLFAFGSSLLSVWALRFNIERLRRGTERKIGQPVAPEQVDVTTNNA